MKVVFADTGYWQAMLSPRDRLHARAVEVSRSLGRVRQVTTEMVLAELLAALSGVKTRSLATALVRIFDSSTPSCNTTEYFVNRPAAA